MKIYTKTGDNGTTALFGGKRVSKADTRMELLGNIDELNSMLGVVIVLSRKLNVRILGKDLARIQGELLLLGADIATPFEIQKSLLRSKSFGGQAKVKRISEKEVASLEEEIDEIEKKLDPLVNFILPGGHEVAALLHLARSVARRAERSLVRLQEQEKINPEILKYMNRLSDWLFVQARMVNNTEGFEDMVWKG